MEQLKTLFPGREKEIDLLESVTSFHSDYNSYSSQSIFVYGPPSTGKTSVVSNFFGQQGAYVNCIECFTPRLLFEHAFNQISSYKPTHANGYTCSRRLDNIQQFVRAIKEIVPLDSATKYLILDKAERLRDMPPTILPSLLRLSEITERNISVVLISNLVFEKFRLKGGVVEPFIIRFSEYTEENAIRILEMDFRESTSFLADTPKPSVDTSSSTTTSSTTSSSTTSDSSEAASDMDDTPSSPRIDQTFYRFYIQNLYAALYQNCKDLNELRYFASLLFPIYIQPIKDNVVKLDDPNKHFTLLKLAQKYFNEVTEKLYLRELSSAEWLMTSRAAQMTHSGVNSPASTRTDIKLKYGGVLELPYYTKFLLIASYLASYNPPRFDVRYFAKSTHEKVTKKKGGGTRKTPTVVARKKKDNIRQQLLGPKAFPVERMLAIFYSILDDDTLEDTVDVQLQLTSLTTLRLLVRTTSMERLDNVKYKCNVGFELVKEVARSVKFEVEKYLYDFS
ncbi:origin recognition complex subunit 5 C-terminus-domain-containing protein [Mycotypha africana]|uniref:origin recognition complex subunit 5 C-terminus-domain-containing protein n=1 Tax=Mycotypha africana TaxID=64632 RepID=UPI0023002856|nr:origin recognition complex subunit 5 C-terminus-domain-containing protein [Mycotypha africana]KAI8988064.1 origin recognition complex subunit 5 C-terminus-domain-containing protein [Mycotypha africana]